MIKDLPLLFDYRKLKLLVCICFSSINIFGQYSFTITDENAEPLSGVEIFSEDYSIAEISDNSGLVTLNEQETDKEFIVNYLGFEPQTLTIATIRQMNGIVVLESLAAILEEIVLIGRNEMSREALPYHIESINQEDIQSTNPQSSADALAQHGNLYVQKSQMGGGSPVIRGFEANKVLLVVDGIRMNNAIYRNGHLQNAITVDQAMLENLEVIFGPNSLTYGSDALGGVVHFQTKDPRLSFSENEKLNTNANAYLRYSSANNEKTAHVDFNLGGKKFGSLTSLTYSNFGDLRMGSNRTSAYPDFARRIDYVSTEGTEDLIRTNDDSNIQIGSAYNQFDLLQKFLFQPTDNLQLIANLQFSTSSDVPRYDQLTERSNGQLRFAEWYYGPQKRMLGSIKGKLLKPTSIYDKLIFIFAHQNIHEDRVSRALFDDIRSRQFERVGINSLTIDLSKALSDQHEFYYGFNMQHDIVNSTAEDESISSGITNIDVLTRYPSGGSDMTIYGVYGQYHYATPNQMGHLNLGLRVSGTSINFSYNQTDPIAWPSSFINGIHSTNQSLIWSAGWRQRYEQGWKWRALLSTAFRSPNIDDMAKIRVKGNEVTFPNADLKPERSINAEYSIGKTFGPINDPSVNISVTGFFTQLKDAIVRDAFTQPDGSSLFIDRQDTFQVFANINAQKARIYGLSLNADFDIGNYITLDGSLNLTRGRILEDQGDTAPLAHIPPVYGKFGLAYKAESYDLRFVTRFNGKKPLSEYGGSADNPDFASPEGALGWYTLNVYAGYNLNENMNVSLALENILDKHYLPFASGISGPGFNAGLTVRVKL